MINTINTTLFEIEHPFNHSTSNKTMLDIDVMLGQKVKSYIDELYTSDYALIKHIPVTIEYKYKDNYIIIQEQLNIVEEATSLLEVEKKIAKEIVKLYSKLTRDKIKLGPYPKEMLTYLHKYIV